jgi:hypothetical protein
VRFNLLLFERTAAILPRFLFVPSSDHHLLGLRNTPPFVAGIGARQD